MPQKISNSIKREALEKLKSGLSAKEVANLTGVSARTVDRWKAGLPLKTAMPSGTPASSTAIPVDNKVEDDKTTLDFEDSPEPVQKTGIVNDAMKSLKGMLGIGDNTVKAPVVSAKLDAKRQQFVDAATPTLSLAFMALASYLWGRIDPDYAQLAPTEEVAQRIVQPLIRVYARHASFMTDINPDVADIGASLLALVGYAHVSLKLYQTIKKEKIDAENSQDNISPFRPAESYANQNATSDRSNGHADVRGRSRQYGERNGVDDGHQSGVGGLNLTDKEARQHAALSHLSQLDFEHRARRSGHA